MFGLSEKTQKYVGYGLIGVGVCLGGYALMNKDKKKKGSTAGLGKISSKRKHKSKSKRKAKLLKFGN